MKIRQQDILGSRIKCRPIDLITMPCGCLIAMHARAARVTAWTRCQNGGICRTHHDPDNITFVGSVNPRINLLIKDRLPDAA